MTTRIDVNCAYILIRMSYETRGLGLIWVLVFFVYSLNTIGLLWVEFEIWTESVFPDTSCWWAKTSNILNASKQELSHLQNLILV